MPQSNNAEVEIGGIFLISRNADSNNVEYYKKDALSVLMKSTMFPYDINTKNIGHFGNFCVKGNPNR